MSEAEAQDSVRDQEAKFLTNYDEFAELTDLMRMRGTDTDGSTVTLISDGIFHFEDDQVSVQAFDPMKSVWVNLRKDFSGIRQEGRLVLGSISDFRKYLNRFGEKTLVTTEGEQLKFEDETGKTGGYDVTDEAHIESIQGVDQLPFKFDADDDFPNDPDRELLLDTWFTVDVGEIQAIIEDGDTTDVRKYPLSVESGEVQVRVGDQSNWIETSFTAQAGEGAASSIYGYGMDNVFGNLNGTVDAYLIPDGPLWVHYDEEDYTIDYMIAQDEG